MISDNNEAHEGQLKEEDNVLFNDVEEESLVPVKIKPIQRGDAQNSTFKKEVARIDLGGISNLEEVDQKIEELTDRVNGVWTCKACGKISQRKRDLGWHIETHLNLDCDTTMTP